MSQHEIILQGNPMKQIKWFSNKRKNRKKWLTSSDAKQNQQNTWRQFLHIIWAHPSSLSMGTCKQMWWTTVPPEGNVMKLTWQNGHRLTKPCTSNMATGSSYKTLYVNIGTLKILTSLHFHQIFCDHLSYRFSSVSGKLFSHAMESCIEHKIENRKSNRSLTDYDGHFYGVDE